MEKAFNPEREQPGSKAKKVSNKPSTMNPDKSMEKKGPCERKSLKQGARKVEKETEKKNNLENVYERRRPNLEEKRKKTRRIRGGPTNKGKKVKGYWGT